MTYLLIITLAPSPIPSQIPHTLFNINVTGALYIVKKQTTEKKPKHMKHEVGEIKALVKMSE